MPLHEYLLQKIILMTVIGLTIFGTLFYWKKLPTFIKSWLILAIALGLTQVILMAFGSNLCWLLDFKESIRITILALLLAGESLLIYHYRAKLPRHWSFHIALVLTNWLFGHMIW